MVKVPLNALKNALGEEAARRGFVAFGVAPAARDALRAERLHGWLAENMHGQMDWMAARADQREAPEALWPEAQTVIALGMSYAPPAPPVDVADRGRISVYAQGADYHDVVKRALKALARWLVDAAAKQGLEAGVKVFVDTAPVMEKPLGAAAGLGWQGKHTNMVSRQHGSWLFLGAIMTTLNLPLDASAPDRCGSCDACQRACPTDAFPAPYRLDARRCVSYLTIEHKGPVDETLRAGIGNRIYGCDDCLSACPWNKFAAVGAANRAFLPRAELTAPRLAELLALDDAGFRRVFSGSPIKRIGRDRMVRNCLYAAGNSGDLALVPVVSGLIGDGDPAVAEAAVWALQKLQG